MDNLTIANEILNQLGGKRFLAMTGAKNLLAMENGLQMNLPRNKSRANKLRIKLNGMDLYDMEFIHQSGASKMFECKTVASFDGYYDDMIVEAFEKTTGLRTSL